MDIIEKIEEKLTPEICWDNWRTEYDEGIIEEEYFTVPQVLWNKMNWLQEWLVTVINEDSEFSEHLDTVEETIKLLNILAEHDEKIN